MGIDAALGIDAAGGRGVGGTGPARARPVFEAIGFDPAPGSPAAITALSDTHTAVARALSDAHRDLTQIGGAAGSWDGDAAQSFRATVAELPDYLDKATRSLGAAASALGGWNADLMSMQRSADQLEEQAAEARSRLDTARADPDLGLAGRYFADPGELRAAEQRLASAQAAVARSVADLEAIIERAAALLAQHAERAARVVELLDRARDLAPDEPGFFERWGEQIGRSIDVAVELAGEGLVDVGSAVWKLVQDNANLIAALSDVTADVSTIIGLIGLGLDASVVGAPVGAVFGALSAELSAVALGGHLLARAGGADVANETLVWDGFGIATFGISGAGKVFRAVSGGLTGVAPIIQADREARYGDDAATIFDDIEKYWVPRDPSQWALLPVAPIAVPLINAATDGHAADAQARKEGR